MFCGWRLMNSYEAIQNLGTGLLEIDALTTECKFNGNQIESLSIAHELHGWLIEDLTKHNISVSAVSIASLSVNLELQRAPASSRTKGSFYIGKNGMPIEKGEFFHLKAECRSELDADEAHYQTEKIHYEQWPVGWPET